MIEALAAQALHPPRSVSWSTPNSSMARVFKIKDVDSAISVNVLRWQALSQPQYSLKSLAVGSPVVETVRLSAAHAAALQTFKIGSFTTMGAMALAAASWATGIAGLASASGITAFIGLMMAAKGAEKYKNA